MNKLKESLGRIPAAITLLLFLSTGLLQIWAISAGLQLWLDLFWMPAVMGALVLAWLPVIGQGLGLLAAVQVLGWHAALAGAVFLWPLWFLVPVLLLRRSRGAPHSAEVFDRYTDNRRNVQAHKRADSENLPPHLRARRRGQSAA